MILLEWGKLKIFYWDIGYDYFIKVKLIVFFRLKIMYSKVLINFYGFFKKYSYEIFILIIFYVEIDLIYSWFRKGLFLYFVFEDV